VRAGDGRSKAHCEPEAALPLHCAAGVAAVTRPGSGSNPSIRIISVLEGNMSRGACTAISWRHRFLKQCDASVRGEPADVNHPGGWSSSASVTRIVTWRGWEMRCRLWGEIRIGAQLGGRQSLRATVKTDHQAVVSCPAAGTRMLTQGRPGVSRESIQGSEMRVGLSLLPKASSSSAGRTDTEDGGIE
jgi:hypothetical protein